MPPYKRKYKTKRRYKRKRKYKRKRGRTGQSGATMSNVVRAQQKVHKLMLNTSIYGKLLQTIMTHFRFGLQQCNKESDGLGATQLVNNSSHLPCQILAINNIIQGAQNQPMHWTLQDDMTTFTANNNVTRLQVSGQTPNIDTTTSPVWHNTLLSRWFSLKLMLWQNATVNAEYHIQIVKLAPALQPEAGSLTAEETEQRKTYFGGKLLRHLVTSPILPASGINSNIKGLVKVLYHKKIVIHELSSTKEDKIYKQINLFRYTNKLINYQQGAPLQDLSGNNATTTDLNDENNTLQLGKYKNNNNTGNPQEKDRLYFIITANVPYDNAGTSKQHSFDLNFVHKYSSVYGGN